MSRTDISSRMINAAPSVLYRAFTDPEQVVQWIPPTGMTGWIEHFNARPGGTYRMTLTYDDPATAQGKTSNDTDTIEGRFVELIDNERVVQDFEFVSNDPAFAGTMRMIWSLQPVPGGTEVTFTAQNVPPGISKADHDEGLASSLSNLAAYVEGGG